MSLIENKTGDRAPALPPVAVRWQSRKVADSYDRERFASLAGRLFDRLSRRAIRRALRAIPGGVATALDVPCGTGRATRVALDVTDRVFGGDISPAMLHEARDRLAVFGAPPLMAADIRRQPFPDGSFDCVMAIRLMMHLDAATRRTALAEAARVAKRYVLVEYGVITPWLRLRREIKSAWLRMRGSRYTFVRAVPWSEVREDLAVAGLRLERVFPTARGLSESVMLLCRASG